MINYPNKKNGYTKTKVSIKNRGMQFESLIDKSNEYYLEHGLAVIHKKPIPIQIVKVDYPSRKAAKITEAYYKTPSTTDYNGLYKGHYIDFDVKESRNKTSFPLNNIHTHQYTHLKHIHAHKGIAFLLIYIHAEDTFFCLPFDALHAFIIRSKTGRKSITHEELHTHAIKVKEGINPRIDYLKAVDQLIMKMKA